MSVPGSSVNDQLTQPVVETATSGFLITLPGTDVWIGRDDVFGSPSDPFTWITDPADAESCLSRWGEGFIIQPMGVPVALVPPPFVTATEPAFVIPTPGTSTPLIPAEIRQSAERGWKVFPVAAGTKTPLTKWIHGGHGHAASSDIEQITRWAMRFPGCNWGLVTGEGSGVFVVDTDKETAHKWVVAKGLTNTLTVKTGGGTPAKLAYGYHFYFKHPRGGFRVKNGVAVDVLGGADVRGDGGYVLMPPSVTEHPYVVTNDLAVAEAPQWILELVRDTRPERTTVPSGDVAELTTAQRDHGTNIFLKKCREFEELPAGTGIRNDELNKLGFAAGQMIGAGTFDEAFAEEQFHHYCADYIAQDRGQAPATFRSGMEAGMKSPWDPQELEERRANEAGFGDAPMPEGALTEPPATSTVAKPSVTNVETQDSIAVIFTNRHKGEMLFDRTRSQWLRWNGTYWEVDELGSVYNRIREISREWNYHGKAALASNTFCKGVECHLQNDPAFATTIDKFDRDNYLLNTPGGTFNLRTGLMQPHDRMDLITKSTKTSPIDRGEGLFWRKFLTDFTEGDEERARYLQVNLGSMLSGAIEEHRMTFLTGVPRSGKNTLVDGILELLGDYAKKISSDVLMSQRFKNHPTEIANLKGIRLAVSSELNEGDYWDEARIKELTGDAILSARFMRQDSFQFPRTHKHLVLANSRPSLRCVDDAIKSRFNIFPFRKSFLGKEDRDLPARLRDEAGYILQWLIEGHRMWMEAGKKLPPCAAVAAETTDYFESQSTPQLWLKERCEVIDNLPDLQLAGLMQLYSDYQWWKDSRGEKPVGFKIWRDTILKDFDTVETRKGKCVRRLRLRPRPETGFVPQFAGN